MAQPVPILLYHGVGTECSPAFRRWMVSPQRFAGQMHCLAENGYRSITVSMLAALLRRNEVPHPRTVVITFDDGFRDFRSEALPVLLDVDFVATVYVVSGYVGGTSRWLNALGEAERPMLTWQDINAMVDLGIEVGAHTVSHPQLDILPSGRAWEEITYSKRMLERHLCRQVDSFAYPHGYASRVTRELVRRAGFTSACRVADALSTTSEDPFALSRIIVTNQTEDDYLLRLVSGSGAAIAPPADRLVSGSWRLARRLRRLTHPLKERRRAVPGA